MQAHICGGLSRGAPSPTTWVAGLSVDSAGSPQPPRRIDSALELRVLSAQGDVAAESERPTPRERRDSEVEMGHKRELELELRMSFHNMEDDCNIIQHHTPVEDEMSQETCSSRTSRQYPGDKCKFHPSLLGCGSLCPET